MYFLCAILVRFTVVPSRDGGRYREKTISEGVFERCHAPSRRELRYTNSILNKYE